MDYAAPMSSPVLDTALGNARWFATTHWSVVLAAKRGDSSEAAVVLEKLYRAYWLPLNPCIRREEHNVNNPHDLLC